MNRRTPERYSQNLLPQSCPALPFSSQGETRHVSHPTRPDDRRPHRSASERRRLAALPRPQRHRPRPPTRRAGQVDRQEHPLEDALPGSGHSSPIVVKGKVFLLSATRSERWSMCLDAKTGKELWTKKVPGKIGKTHPKSSLASATPCSDGERVYCVFWDGKKVGLYAYRLRRQAGLGARPGRVHQPARPRLLADRA